MKSKSEGSFGKNRSRVSLGSLAEITGETARQIHRLVAIGEIPRPENRGEYDLTESVRGIVHYYRARASKFSEGRIESATRRERAEAENSEINLLQKKGEISRLFGFEIADLAVTARHVIEQAEYIPLQSRVRLSRDLADIDFFRSNRSRKT